jgi:hypothetical protein
VPRLLNASLVRGADDATSSQLFLSCFIGDYPFESENRSPKKWDPLLLEGIDGGIQGGGSYVHTILRCRVAVYQDAQFDGCIGGSLMAHRNLNPSEYLG